MTKSIQKAKKIIEQLTNKQLKKLNSDYNKTLQTYKPLLEKVNNSIASGYYPYYSPKYKFLKNYKRKILLKCDYTLFIIEHGYKYLNL